jgi:hypothetical protein
VKQPLNAIAIITYLLKDNDSLSMEEVNETATKYLASGAYVPDDNLFRDFTGRTRKIGIPDKESIDMAICPQAWYLNP